VGAYLPFVLVDNTLICLAFYSIHYNNLNSDDKANCYS